MGVADLERVAENAVISNLQLGDSRALPLLRPRSRGGRPARRAEGLSTRRAPHRPPHGSRLRPVARAGGIVRQCASMRATQIGDVGHASHRVRALGAVNAAAALRDREGAKARPKRRPRAARRCPRTCGRNGARGRRRCRARGRQRFPASALCAVSSSTASHRASSSTGSSDGCASGVSQGPCSDRRPRAIDERRGCLSASVGGLEELERRDRRRRPGPSGSPKRAASGSRCVRRRARACRARSASRARRCGGDGRDTGGVERPAERGSAEPGGGPARRRRRRARPRFGLLGKEHLAGPEEGERVRQRDAARPARVKPARREVEERDAPVRLRRSEDREVGGRPGASDSGSRTVSGRHDSRDVAADEPLAAARVLDLIADRDLAARGDELGDVMVDALVGHAAHGRLDVGVAVCGASARSRAAAPPPGRPRRTSRRSRPSGRGGSRPEPGSSSRSTAGAWGSRAAACVLTASASIASTGGGAMPLASRA